MCEELKNTIKFSAKAECLTAGQGVWPSRLDCAFAKKGLTSGSLWSLPTWYSLILIFNSDSQFFNCFCKLMGFAHKTWFSVLNLFYFISCVTVT